jgi:hypothetical protein
MNNWLPFFEQGIWRLMRLWGMATMLFSWPDWLEKRGG